MSKDTHLSLEDQLNRKSRTMPFCTKCGKQIEGAEIFCPDCADHQTIVSLEFNTKFSYFPDCTRPLEYTVKNWSDQTIKNLELIITSPEINLSKTLFARPIKPNGKVKLRHNCHFPPGGSALVTLKISICFPHEKQTLNYMGSHDVDVFEGKSEDTARHYNISAGEKVIFSNIEEASVTNGGPFSYIDELLKKERQDPDNWEDVEINKKTGRFCLSKSPSKRILKSLMIVNKDKPEHRYYIFTKPVLDVGRPGDVSPDIHAVIYPFKQTDPNSLSRRISRNQFQLRVQDSEIVIKNQSSVTSLGTCIDGKRMGNDEEISFDKELEVDLGMVLKFSLKNHREHPTKKRTITTKDWENIPGVPQSESDYDPLEELYETRHVNAVSMKRNSLLGEENRPDEQYVLVSRFVTIGSDPRNEIVIKGRRIAARHARIYYYCDHMYLHVLEDGLENTMVDGHKPFDGEIIPLEGKEEIDLAGNKWKVRKVSWKYSLPGDKKK